ncbi:MAG: tetratricopeptide repeat protein [Methylophilaceae bacterium]|nr:tetratricopeptide repeat protein [Methylophilaceae bacterium]
MAYDLEEQEQIDEFKAWWKRYGNMLMNVIIAALVVYSALQAWKYYQNKQSVEASSLYQVLTQINPTDVNAIKMQSAKIIENFKGTPYAGRAALLAAKANYHANDSKSAKAQLEWSAKNAKESAVKAMAILQLAGILVEEKNYDAAIKVLDESKDAGFAGLNADLKGDIYVALGKSVEAKKAYQEALTRLDLKGRYHQYTSQKLEALG